MFSYHFFRNSEVHTLVKKFRSSEISPPTLKHKPQTSIPQSNVTMCGQLDIEHRLAIGIAIEAVAEIR